MANRDRRSYLILFYTSSAERVVAVTPGLIQLIVITFVALVPDITTMQLMTEFILTFVIMYNKEGRGGGDWS